MLGPARSGKMPETGARSHKEAVMPSPFPGMDPFLENPQGWGDVHGSLLAVTKELLNRVLRPKYAARTEERVYLADAPAR